MNRNFTGNSCHKSCGGVVMNETAVSFGQVMVVLQILLAARFMRYGAAMKLALVRISASCSEWMKWSGFGKNLCRMQKPMQGEKI